MAKRNPIDAQLEVGMHDIDLMLPTNIRKLHNATRGVILLAETDRMGVTSVKEVVEGHGYHVEHSNHFPSEIIARYFGYLAAQDLGRTIHFMRPDGTEHPIQLDDNFSSRHGQVA